MKKEIVCPVCGGRGYVSWVNSTETSCYSGSKTCPHCNGTRWVEVDMTNADHIRSMTDEELAEWLEEIDNFSGCLILLGNFFCKSVKNVTFCYGTAFSAL